MSVITDNRLEVKKYFALYESCSQQEQTILQVLSVIYKPVTQTNLKKILANLSKVKLCYGARLAATFSPQVREKLKAQGLIEITKGITLSPFICHSLTKLAIDNGVFEQIVAQANAVVPLEPTYSWGSLEPQDRDRKIRDSFYRGQYDTCEQLLEFNQNPQQIDLQKNLCLINFCFSPFEPAFFSTLAGNIQYQAFATLILYLRRNSLDNSEVVTLLQSLYEQQQCTDDMRLLLAEQYLRCGQVDKAGVLLAEEQACAYGLALSGWLACLRGKMAAAIACFQQSLSAKNKISRRKRQYIGGSAGIFYLLALLKRGNEEDPSQLNSVIAEAGNYLADSQSEQYEKISYSLLQQLAQVLAGKQKSMSFKQLSYLFYKDDYYYHQGLLICTLCSHWLGKQPEPSYLASLTESFELAVSVNRLWYGETAARILSQYQGEHQASQDFLASQRCPHINFFDLVKPKARWQQALDQLIALKQEKQVSGMTTPGTEQKQCRMIWLLDCESSPYRLEPREQKWGKKGWTKGRVVALKRLYEEGNLMDYLTPEDLNLCRAITKGYDDYYRGSWGRSYYSLSGYPAFKACVGHPNLYHINDISRQIELVEGEPQLLISQQHNGYQLHMSGLPKDIDEYESYYSFIPETANRYRLVNYTGKHLEIAAIVGHKGLKVPKKAKDKVLESIGAIAPLLNIQSDITGIADIDTGIERVDADQTLYINIQPAGAGLQLECHVQPLGAEGPRLLPGAGNSTVFGEIVNKRLMTIRDLALEKQHLVQLVERCPLFSYMTEHTLVLDELEDALACLEQLAALQAQENAPKLALQWPKGQAIRLTKPAAAKQMKIALSKHKDWFGLDGDLIIADDEILELKKLLSLVEQSPGRFIPLGDNAFLSLTEELRQQLNAIAGATQAGKFHSLAVPLIEEATRGMQVKSNRAWQQQVKRLKEAYGITPELPSTLQGELRDYQKDGFDWAYRLAHWGAGACLADDMGLGKTLQSLALILSRAAHGPTLVLAPTSVCFNWQEEAARFAPSLKVKLFGIPNKNERQAMLAEAGALDLIICSYGLLQTESERLAKVSWRTIIADEAQAIKNPQAKRTQAAMALSGEFKMITTGTPIENNLTELWSLFRFINPGLLGSQEQFNKRFANPIESPGQQDKIAQKASQGLRHLIAPFILRRLKSEVLPELPSRTEINLHIELSKEEIAFYEALRQQAVEKLAQAGDQPGQKRIKILAEIMRLRRACCHPSLVMEQTDISGAKLKAFDELVDELRQNQHKALVFSQFVDHLGILREHLDKKGVSYQYLDGSTPAAKRKKAVNAFQAGEGDLFLISLKAGGAGLNLTAADYVIHMDPWWNPAVEDQASDRAHRMGQTRPVTIYRLIAQNTIEDKIVSLHQQKRDLANSLLEGADSTGKLSVDAMMALLQQDMSVG